MMIANPSDEEKKVCITLIDGQLVQYDACDMNKNPVYESWYYLGQGTIYSIDFVVLKKSTKVLHFWAKQPLFLMCSNDESRKSISFLEGALDDG